MLFSLYNRTALYLCCCRYRGGSVTLADVFFTVGSRVDVGTHPILSVGSDAQLYPYQLDNLQVSASLPLLFCIPDTKVA